MTNAAVTATGLTLVVNLIAWVVIVGLLSIIYARLWEIWKRQQRYMDALLDIMVALAADKPSQHAPPEQTVVGVPPPTPRG